MLRAYIENVSPARVLTCFAQELQIEAEGRDQSVVVCAIIPPVDSIASVRTWT